MNTYRARRSDREEYDWRPVQAWSPEEAARELIYQHESESVEFPVASGHETALVEVEGHGQWEVHGDPRPHYFTRRR